MVNHLKNTHIIIWFAMCVSIFPNVIVAQELTISQKIEISRENTIGDRLILLYDLFHQIQDTDSTNMLILLSEFELMEGEKLSQDEYLFIKNYQLYISQLHGNEQGLRKKARELAKLITNYVLVDKYSDLYIESHITLTDIYLNLFQLDSAVVYSQKLEILLNDYEDVDAEQRSTLYNTKAIVASYLGNYSKAIEYGLMELEADIEIGEPWHIINAKHNLVDSYMLAKDYEEAKILLDEVQKESIKYGFRGLELSSLAAQAYIEIENNNYEKAVSITSMLIDDVFEQQTEQSAINVRHGRALIGIGKFKEAEWYLNKGIKEGIQIGYPVTEIFGYLGYGELELARGNITKGFAFYKKAKLLAEEIKNDVILNVILEKWHQAYIENKFYKEAVELLEYKQALSDSLYSVVESYFILEMETKFGSIQQKNLIKEQAEKIALEKSRVRSILLIVVFFIVLVIFLVIQTIKIHKSNLRLEAQQQQIEDLVVAKDQFFMNAAHELRTPLTLVLNPLQQLKKQSKTFPDLLKQNLNLAVRNTKRLQFLTEQMLEIGLLETNKQTLELLLEPIVKITKNMIASFDSVFYNQGIKINIYLPKTEIYWPIDRDKYEKILVNLISNAVKHTPKKGSIGIELSVQKNKTQIVLIVRDTGLGIPEAEHLKVFERFYSGQISNNLKQNGLGVGLHLTKEFVEMHEGTISLNSAENEGAEFTIMFPWHNNITFNDKNNEDNANIDQLAEEPVFKIKPLSDIRVKNKKILLVEDNIDMRAYVSSLLRNEGFDVLNAQDGFEGKKKATLFSPDLIITDVMMPKVDGFEFSEFIRSVPELKLVPILMLTALSNENKKTEAYKIGVSDYVIKPFSESQLLARVSNLLELKIERDQVVETTNSTNKDEKSIPTQLIEILYDYVLSNLDNELLTSDSLAVVANKSRSSLYRSLKSSTGYTPAEFIKEIRLNEARILFENKKVKTIQEVCEKVGIRTPSYLSKLYKERFGISPKDLI